MRYLSRRLILIFCAILMAFPGCKPANPQGRLALSGTVSLNGSPLKNGVISFEPVSSDVKTSSGGSVIEGRYSAPAHLGLVEGDYIVRIYAYETIGGIDPTTGESVSKTLIPPKYNQSDKLQVTVTKNKKTYDFDLTVAPGDFK